MVRRANKKQKGRPSRPMRKIIMIATEGGNRTEQTYFAEFNRKQNECHIVFADGNSTDPVKIVKEANKSANNQGIRKDYGDTVIAVFDADFDKQEQIRMARELARKNKIEIIISNPCFEVWLLQHFRFSTRGYHSNNDVISELTNRWPEYRKNIESFQYLADRTELAIDNARRLDAYHNNVNPGMEIEDRNPATNVYKLVERVYPKGGDEEQYDE